MIQIFLKICGFFKESNLNTWFLIGLKSAKNRNAINENAYNYTFTKMLNVSSLLLYHSQYNSNRLS
jgi:hypothetical protein